MGAAFAQVGVLAEEVVGHARHGSGPAPRYHGGHDFCRPPAAAAVPLLGRPSTRDFAALQSTGQTAQVVAVLPVAAVEQHGPHLPLSVDATLLQGVIDAALPHLGPMCLRCSCRRKTLA